MAERTQFHVWISKYALTQGICSHEEARETSTGGIITKSSGDHDIYYSKGDWHRDEASAKKRAEEMQQAKIRSLEKQLAKLREMTF